SAMTSDTAISSPARGRGGSRIRILRVLAVEGRRPTTPMLESTPGDIGREGHGIGTLGLADSEASRPHPGGERDPDGTWVIVDQGSRNGTFLDGVRVDRGVLRDGSVIRVGKTLILHAEAEVRGSDGVAPPTDTSLIGTSLAMLRVHGDIEMVAPHEVPVL